PAPSIYVFDPASGTLLKRMVANDAANARVDELAWSPDGRYLASGQSGVGGLRLFRTSDWTVVGEDRGYTSPISGLGFTSSGSLLVGSEDGVLRRYRTADSGIELVLAKSVPRKSLQRLRVSPDGTRVAIASGGNQEEIDILNAESIDRVSRV